MSVLKLSKFDAAKIKFTVSLKYSEYDQEIPQSQTADKPMASRGRAAQQS